MKSKRFLCTVLACVVMISCITNAAAIQEEVADDFVEYNTESILTTRAIGEFEMTVSAKTKAIADSRHTDHFVCPFVINTSGLINDQLYAIGGDIWVNYTDTWS